MSLNHLNNSTSHHPKQAYHNPQRTLIQLRTYGIITLDDIILSHTCFHTKLFYDICFEPRTKTDELEI